MPETFIHRKITDIPGGQIATVRTETHTAGQIKRGVNTKTHVVFQGDGIDQVMDPGRGIGGKIISLTGLETVAGLINIDTGHLRDTIRAKPRAVYQDSCPDTISSAVYFQLPCPAVKFNAGHLRAAGDNRAFRFGGAEK